MNFVSINSWITLFGTSRVDHSNPIYASCELSLVKKIWKKLEGNRSLAKHSWIYLCRGTAIRTAVCSSGLLRCTQRRPTHHSGITVERTSWTGRPHTMRNFQGVGSSTHILSPGTFIRLVTESIPWPRKFPKGMRIVGPASWNRERLAGKQSSPSSHYGRVYQRPTGVQVHFFGFASCTTLLRHSSCIGAFQNSPVLVWALELLVALVTSWCPWSSHEQRIFS